MAYVVPTTRADGYVVDATEWNKNTVDNPIALKALIDAIVSGGKYVCNGRLSLTTGVAVTNSDVTAATTLYWVPYLGNQLALYSGSAWVMFTQAQLSITVPATTNTMYDVFVDYNSGTPALSLTAWTNDTTRATALTTQDGVYVLTGTTTKRYVGSFRTTAVSGQAEDSLTYRGVWNYYNRVRRALLKADSTGTWTYTTATWRQQRGTATNQVAMVQGVAEQPVSLTFRQTAQNDTGGGMLATIAIGEDSTTAPESANAVALMHLATANTLHNATAILEKVPTAGYHYYTMLEGSTASGTTTWQGASTTTVATSTTAGTGIKGGLQG